jgi:aconitate hydratase
MGMIAIGAGGLDVAAAMAGEPFYIDTPKIINIHLTGKLQPFVSAKDVILAVLQKITVKGGVNKILEYTGPGVKTLTVPERGTITNMGTETGATTSVFPSDEVTRDLNAVYSETIEIDLSKVEPLIALPHSPDAVQTVREVAGTPVDQVCIGSCTNSSLRDMKMVAALLKGKKISTRVSLTISPGSRQVLENLAASGELVDIIRAGARIIENACGPCIGIGQAPPSGGVSLRTFNRNFKGRSGTKDAQVYLVSPETAVAAALTGVITDPRSLKEYPQITLPDKFLINDAMFIFPDQAQKGEIVMGPNIKPLPSFPPLQPKLTGEVILKVADNISTDDILPGGSEVMALRSNIPEISKHTFRPIDPEFAARAQAKGGGFIVGGENYGQGSSREHAALAPKYLGVKAVLVKSFARIHLANLINFGIVPLTFANKQDHACIAQGDVLELDTANLQTNLTVKNLTTGVSIPVVCDLTELDRKQIRAGGKLAAIKQKQVNA